MNSALTYTIRYVPCEVALSSGQIKIDNRNNNDDNNKCI